MIVLRGTDRVITAGPHSFVARLEQIASWTAEPIGRQFGSIGKDGLSDSGERHGGAICYMNQAGVIMGHLIVGKPNRFKSERFERNSFVKCGVMFVNQAESNCVSSWPYRSELSSPPVYGGGIVLDLAGGFLAFTGYTEYADEAYVLAFAELMGLTTPERNEAILAASGNSRALVDQISEAMKKIVYNTI